MGRLIIGEDTIINHKEKMFKQITTLTKRVKNLNDKYKKYYPAVWMFTIGFLFFGIAGDVFAEAAKTASATTAADVNPFQKIIDFLIVACTWGAPILITVGLGTACIASIKGAAQAVSLGITSACGGGVLYCIGTIVQLFQTHLT